MAAGETRAIVRRALRDLARAPADRAAPTEIAAARRIDALVWASAALVSLVYLALAPPSVALGAAGWPLAAAAIATGLWWARRLLDRGRAVTYDHLLLASYVGVAALAGVGWLAGGAGAPYDDLLILALISALACHPTRRGLLLTAAVVLADLAPYLYDAAATGGARAATASAVLWCALTVAGVLLMASLRAQRASLASGVSEAHQLARIDGLTGLGNRRALDEALGEELSRARRHGEPLCVAMVDMDGLKEINDRHGHLEGDDCLRQVAVTLRDTVRAADRCFRWGGDEFVMVLPATPIDEARRVCQRVSTAVRRSCATSAGEPLTVSCGSAALPEQGGPEELMRAADRALLSRKRFKRNGRRREPRQGSGAAEG